MDNSFYVDSYGEYYRFKEEDVLDNFTLSDSVPDFVRRLFDKGTITAGFLRTGIGQPNFQGIALFSYLTWNV